MFVNNENTFSEFQFSRPIVSDVFVPKVSIARVRRPQLSSADDIFMRLDFCSKFDGALQPSDRPPIDVSFVLDISGRQAVPPTTLLSLSLPQRVLLQFFSREREVMWLYSTYSPGSMSSGFPEDPDRRTKLDVAKDCLLHVSKQLGPRDRMSVITFDTSTKTVLPSDHCTPRHLNKQVPFSLPLNTPSSIVLTCSVIQAFQSFSRCALWWWYQSVSRYPGGL